MRRSGFALLTVLWVIVALTAVAGASLAVARRGADASRNRILLTRAGWARNACEEIMLARYAAQGSIIPLDTTDLGRGVWCQAQVEEAGTRVDVNRATSEVLLLLFGNDSLADALLDWRDPDDLPRPHGAERQWYQAHSRREPRNAPLADVAELRLIRGFDSATVQRLEPLLTTRGSGQVNLNTASASVLATLPGLDARAADLIIARRMMGQPLRGTDELLSRIPASTRERLLGRYQEFASQAAYESSRMLLVVEGGAGTPALVSRARLTVLPVPGRLAVIRREVR